MQGGRGQIGSVHYSGDEDNGADGGELVLAHTNISESDYGDQTRMDRVREQGSPERRAVEET